MELRIDFGRLLAHDRWANGRALESVEALPDPPAKAVFLVAHVLGAEVAWIDRMTSGRDPADWERWDRMDLPAARRAFEEEVPARWAAFLADGAASDPARTCSYVNFLGKAYDARVEDALLQLMLHGAYHRGQVAAAVRAAGGEPAVVDFLQAVRGGVLS